MAELEKRSGIIKPSEEPSPRHGKSVDPNSIKKGSINAGE